MKFATAIFAVYLLLLSLVPCADKETCDGGIVASSQQAPDEDETQDTCTPFCICSCCHNIISLPTIPRIEPMPVVAHVAKPEIGYVDNTTKDVTVEFFQPPRVS